MKNNIGRPIYFCTDRRYTTTMPLEECIEKAIKGGVTLVQLREKNCSGREFFEIGVRVKKITDRHRVPLIVNDRADIALALDAAGVHVGQADIPAREVRRIVGANKIVGVSAATVADAIVAEKDGADYIGAGAVYATATKRDASTLSANVLRHICESVAIPVVAIGGINATNIAALKDTGVAGVAVVSAIAAAADPQEAAAELLRLWRN